MPAVPELAILDYDAVLRAVSPEAAIDRVRDAFLKFHAGEWVMPAKVYLQSPPYGDFRAMPARGGDLALLKWITSFPGNPPGRGRPAVTGVICLLGRDHRSAADAARSMRARSPRCTGAGRR